MKESIDDLTNQAIDLVLENDALHKRIVEPLKRKILPYVACSVLTNCNMFIILVYLARRLSLLPSLPRRFFLLFIITESSTFGWWFIFLKGTYLSSQGVFPQS